MFSNVKLHEVSCVTASLHRWVYETQIYFFAEFGCISSVCYYHRECWVTAAARCFSLCTALQRGFLPSLLSRVTQMGNLLVELTYSQLWSFFPPFLEQGACVEDHRRLAWPHRSPDKINRSKKASKCRKMLSPRNKSLTIRCSESRWAGKLGSWNELTEVDFGWMGGYTVKKSF